MKTPQIHEVFLIEEGCNNISFQKSETLHMNELLEELDKIMPISETLASHLSKIFSYKIFRKNDYLIKAGRIDQTVYFIQQGLVRCFYYKGDTNISSNFLKENDWTLCNGSFLNRTVSIENVQALETTEVWCASWPDFQSTFDKFPEFNTYVRMLFQQYQINLYQQLFIIRANNAKKRYDLFSSKYPELLRRIPKKYIASYIDIADVTLRKISQRSKARR